jgi:hypothetical protein
MAGTGKNEYEEWQLYAFPAKRTVQGVFMMILFLAWMMCAALLLPSLITLRTFTRRLCTAGTNS